jgi:SIR2-like domain
MSDPTEQVIKLAQKCVGHIPVVVLGSGASIQYGIGGMGALKDHLLASINPVEADEKDAWILFSTELAKTGDLEMALYNVRLPTALEAQVVSSTRDMVLRDDLTVFENFVQGKVEFSLSALLRYLLRTTHPTIQVVTTNYDRIAEYACDAANAAFDTGFRGGYLQAFRPGDDLKFGGRVVEILKVHGSLDWFLDEHQSVIALPDSVKAPKSYSPLLVTPGTGKYYVTHEEPFRTIITRSDAAFASARSALCVGYGFNDRHIQPKLTNRVLKEKVPIVILAKALTPRTKDFLNLCKHPHYLALEMSGTGSRAFCADHPAGVDLPEPIWDLGHFVEAVAGK